MEITSEQTEPAPVGAHDGLNSNGDTNIFGNGRDGIRIATSGGTSDILITSDTGSTTINGNGTVAGGNGIRWDADGTTDSIVRVTRTTVTGSIAGATESGNGNGVLDDGEDINGNGVLDAGEDGSNEDVDVADGDGIQFNAFGNTTATLIVGGDTAADGNRIQNNADDGVALTATGRDNLADQHIYFVAPNSGFNPASQMVVSQDIPRPIITIRNNTIGGENEGVAAGNGGDGISLNELGGTLDVSFYGADPDNVDTNATLDDPFPGAVSIADGVTQSGAIVQLTASDNVISNNGRRGVNLLLNGAGGIRDRENGNSLFDPNRISLLRNTIASNGMEGIYFRADTDMNQGRATYLPNFADPPFDPAGERPQTPAFYDPMLAEFQGDNVGSVNGTTAFAGVAPDGEEAYLNLRTVQNTLLTILDNTIQSNGVAGVTGEGLVLSVGTGAYLAADVQSNVFSGNLEDDFRTESFLSFGETYDSVDDSGDTNYDVIYHDDTAQLDLRFFGNSGNQISISSDGATFTTRDALKEIDLDYAPSGLFGVSDRDAAFFQVDNGVDLDDPSNIFNGAGGIQDIDAEFISGGFNLRGAADPLFPNIGFAPFLP